MARRGDYDYLLLREKKLQVFCQLQRAQRSTYLDRSKKKLEQLMIEYAKYFPTFTAMKLSTLKVPIKNTVLNKCLGGDFHEFYLSKFGIDRTL